MMVDKIIEALNSIITKATFILHIETTKTIVKSVNKITFNLYIQRNKEISKLKSFSRTLNINEPIAALDNDAIKEILKFIIKSNIIEYE